MSIETLATVPVSIPSKLSATPLRVCGHTLSLALLASMFAACAEPGTGADEDDSMDPSAQADASVLPTVENGLIAIGRQDPDNSEFQQISLMNEEGEILDTLTSEGSNFHPEWSFDGTEIVFISMRSGRRELFVMDADGSNQRPVDISSYSQDIGRPQMPFMSPSKEDIIFIGGFIDIDVGPKLEVFRVSLVTSEVTRLTFTEGTNLQPNGSIGNAGCGWPRYSSDGQHIAYTSNQNVDGIDLNTQIWIMDADGTNHRRITAGFNSGQVNKDGHPNANHSYWAPDSGSLVMAGGIDGGTSGSVDIWKVDLNDDKTAYVNAINFTQITTTATADAPAFSPDGKHVLYGGNEDGPPALYLISPDGSNKRKLRDAGDLLKGNNTMSWQPVLSR